MENALKIPDIELNTIQYFVDDVYMGNITTEQLAKIRANILQYIIVTKNTAILNKIYFIGHEDSNDKPGKRVRITMDKYGNLSDLPWECNHVRRSLLSIIDMTNEFTEIFKNLK